QEPRLFGGQRPGPRLPGAAQNSSDAGPGRQAAHGDRIMTSPHASCRAIEPDLVAAATGDANRDASRRVEEHLAGCEPCRAEFARYRVIERAIGDIRSTDWQAREDEPGARARLESILADLRRRVLVYRIFPSPLGNILIARSEHGVALV